MTRRPAGRRPVVTRTLAGAATIAAAVVGATPAPAATLPRPGLPVAGASVVVAPQRDATDVFWPGDGWLRLRAAAALPLGLTLDATHGTVLLKSARDAAGAVQVESVGGGAFSVAQTASAAPMTMLTLSGGHPAACPQGTGSRSSASTTVVRKLFFAGGGRLQVTATNAIARTSGAVWMIADRCDGTEVSVRSGRVIVWRTRPGAARRLHVVRAGRALLFTGPAPGPSAALPVPRSTGSSPGRAGSGGPATTAPATAPGPVGPTPAPSGPAPLSPAEQLTALVSTVDALGLSGQGGQDLDADLQSVETALTFGTTGATCTALGTVGQAIFENADAPAGAIPAATATSLLSATVAIDAALACPAPVAPDLRASNELLASIGSIEAFGIDPSVADGLISQLGEAGQAFVIGDEADGCLDAQFLGSAIGLIELGSSGPNGLTSAEGQTISSQVSAIETQLSCSTVAPSGG